MRRIGVVVLTTLALAGLAAPVEAAQAAPPDKRKWAAPDGIADVAAWGTYTRGDGRVVIRGRLADAAKDGRTACVRFKATERGRRAHVLKAAIVVRRGGRHWYHDGEATVRITTSSPNTGHLHVQECSRNTETGAWEYARTWRRIY
ncbi:MAG TPA: hypothetical protein VHJ17_23205 [Thermomonospora sp.]|nr:hypothetical protein [Thermomonospora sp.]